MGREAYLTFCLIQFSNPFFRTNLECKQGRKGPIKVWVYIGVMQGLASKLYPDNRTCWNRRCNPRPWELPSACVGVVNLQPSCLTLGPHRNLVGFRACQSYNVAFFVDLGQMREVPDWALARSRTANPGSRLM